MQKRKDRDVVMTRKSNYLYAAAAVAAVLIGSSIIYSLHGSSALVVAQGDNISVYYTGTLSNGTVFSSNVGGQPLNFTVGSGQVIMGFDNGVIGMSINQTKTITIPASEAYGEANPALVVTVPISAFGNHTVYKGMTVVENYSGQQREGTVTSLNSSDATVDFNPPLAGQALTFTIKVVSIRRS